MLKEITLGILYSGQLETQLVKSAKKLGGIKTIILTDDQNGPAQHFCDKFICGDLNDKKVLKKYVVKTFSEHGMLTSKIIKPDIFIRNTHVL